MRDPEAYARGYVAGATKIPLGQLRSRLSEIILAPEVHFICQFGRRSAQAAQVLTTEGMRAVNIDGGTMAWLQGGLPIEGQHR